MTVADPVPVLQLYSRQYRIGTISPSGRPVRSRTVEDAVRAVGQAFTSVGAADPRLNLFGKLDFRLQRQLACYTKRDPPPSRVKPVPLPILQHAATHCYRLNTEQSAAIADMLILGFFFLLRPGEYAATNSPDSAPFRLCDCHIFMGHQKLDIFGCPEAHLHAATFIGMEFSTQKNGVRGEVIGLTRSASHLWCPVAALVRRVLYLRAATTNREIPLYSYQAQGRWCAVHSTHLTHHLRSAVCVLGPSFGIAAGDISARSLRSSGAMALLCANLDTDKIRLLGRWRSDEMLRYLHVQAYPIVSPLASAMLQHGDFNFIPAAAIL